MKIQCDVCEKVQASLFCPSDEAALCHGCDLSIHHANKLATKHTRFSLIHLHSKEFPLCDICQNNCSEFKDQDIHVSKYLFPQVTCVPLAQVQSTQLTNPIPLNLPRIDSTVGVKEIPGKSRHSR